MLKLIALLERPTRGTVLINNRNTSTMRSGQIPAFRRNIGVVFQDHKLLADRPVYDNVALPLIVSDTPMREIDKRVRAALDQVGLLGKERMLPLELSVGEQQRVGIARAVVSKPPLLIADEPTAISIRISRAKSCACSSAFRKSASRSSSPRTTCDLVRELGQREIVIENGQVRGATGDDLPSVVATR